MAQKFANNFSTTLASAIATAGVATCALTSTTGLPTLSAGDIFYATLSNPSETTFEVVRVTGMAGTTATITRGQDGTSAASSWASGSTFSVRPVAGELRDIEERGFVHVWTYLTDAQKADVSSRTGSLDVTTPVQAAITAAAGGTVILPKGKMKVSALTVAALTNTSIVGMGRDLTYGSVLAYSGTSGTCLTINEGASAGDYGRRFANFVITGSGSAANTDDGLAICSESLCIVEDVYINGAGRYGFNVGGTFHCDKILFKSCVAQACGKDGFYARHGLNGYQINAITFDHCEFTQNTRHGMNIWLNVSNIHHCTIQGNSGSGIYIGADDLSNPSEYTIQGLNINGCYFEENVLGNIKAYTQYSASPDTIHYCTDMNIDHNYFLLTTSTAPTASASVMLTGTTAGSYKGLFYGFNTHQLTGVGALDGNSLLEDQCTIRMDYDDTGHTNIHNLYLNITTCRLEEGGMTLRTSTAPETTSADYYYQRSFDTTNNVMSIAVNVGATAADWKAIMPYTGTAAPVAGYWKRGTIFWNSLAAPGAAIGWMCGTAGTPGTWKALANL